MRVVGDRVVDEELAQAGSDGVVVFAIAIEFAVRDQLFKEISIT